MTAPASSKGRPDNIEPSPQMPYYIHLERLPEGTERLIRQDDREGCSCDSKSSPHQTNCTDFEQEANLTGRPQQHFKWKVSQAYHIARYPCTPSEYSVSVSDFESEGESDAKVDSKSDAGSDNGSDNGSDIDIDGGVKLGVEGTSPHPSSPAPSPHSWDEKDANNEDTEADDSIPTNKDTETNDDTETIDDIEVNDDFDINDYIETIDDTAVDDDTKAKNDTNTDYKSEAKNNTKNRNKIVASVETVIDGIDETNDDFNIDGEVYFDGQVRSLAEVESEADSKGDVASVIDANGNVKGNIKAGSKVRFGGETKSNTEDEAGARSASTSPRPPPNFVFRPQPPWNEMDFMDFKSKSKTKSISADSSISMRNNIPSHADLAREQTPTLQNSRYPAYSTIDDNDSLWDNHSTNDSSRWDDDHWDDGLFRTVSYAQDDENSDITPSDSKSTVSGVAPPKIPLRTHRNPRPDNDNNNNNISSSSDNNNNDNNDNNDNNNNTNKQANAKTYGRRTFRPGVGARPFDSDPNPFMPRPFPYPFNTGFPRSSTSKSGLNQSGNDNAQNTQWQHYVPPPPPPPPSPPPPRPPQQYFYQPTQVDQPPYSFQSQPQSQQQQFGYQPFPSYMYAPPPPPPSQEAQPSPVWPPLFNPANPYYRSMPPNSAAPGWPGPNEQTPPETPEEKDSKEGLGATNSRTGASTYLNVPRINTYGPKSIDGVASPTGSGSNTGTTKVGSCTEASKPTKPPLYKRLSESEIRLIRIRPFTSSQTLKMSLDSTSLQNPPRYTALSYAWGEGTESVEVDIDGHMHQITSNLYEALRVLQERDRDVLCWADALAINQKDQAEVTEQVKLMREIYRAAASVTVWLGESSHDSDLALDLIRSLAKHSNANNVSDLQKLIMSPKSRQSFTALASLFERHYWRRLWIVQEILNARHVNILCGSSSLPWEMYKRATTAIRWLTSFIDETFASWLEDNTQSLYVSSKSRMSYSEIFLKLGPAPFDDIKSLLWSNLGSDERSIALKFHIALCICRSRFATNERDKVYGLLGAVPEDVQRHIVPDYSITVKDVYTKAAEYIINGTKSLDILGSAFHFPVHITPMGLPSWVPDWSHISPMNPINWPIDRFSAGSKVDADFCLDSQHHQDLSIRAIGIDKVARRGIPVNTTNTVDEFIMAFINWFAMLQGHIPDDATEYQRLQAEESFCRILVLDNVHPLFKSPSDVWRQVTFYLFASLARKNLPGLILDPRLAAYADEGSVNLLGISHNAIIQESFSPGMTGRSFFLTKCGIMGMGSGYLAAGDTAVVPFGCSTPLLLRSDGEHGKYRLVSDAYLDTYMYGRAIEEFNKGNGKPERFTVH